MNLSAIIFRSLRYFAGANLAVALGVAVATAVLCGALMVGDSVRASLRRIAEQRLGPIDAMLATPTLFEQSLGERLRETDRQTKLLGVGLFMKGGAESAGQRSAGVQINALQGSLAQVGPGEAITRIYVQPPYPSMSWHALFAGYGTFPAAQKVQPLPPGVRAADRQAIEAMLAACATNFPDYMPVTSTARSPSS